MAAVVVVVDSVSLSRSPAVSAGQVLLKYSHVAVLTFLISGTGSITVPPIPTQKARTALTISPERAPCFRNEFRFCKFFLKVFFSELIQRVSKY